MFTVTMNRSAHILSYLSATEWTVGGRPANLDPEAEVALRLATVWSGPHPWTQWVHLGQQTRQAERAGGRRGL